MKNFIFLWLMTTFQQVQSCTKNYMTYEAPLDREICLMGLNYISNKSWKLQFSASSSIIIIEDYYLLFYDFYAIICINHAALRCKLFILSDIQSSQFVVLAEQPLKTSALAYIQGS